MLWATGVSSADTGCGVRLAGVRGSDHDRPDVEDVGVGAQRFGLDPGRVGEIDDGRLDAGEGGRLARLAIIVRRSVDVAHRLADLDVAAFVEILERDREGAEGSPHSSSMPSSPLRCSTQLPVPWLEQTAAAFAHQRVVAVDLDTAGLQFDQLAEDVGGPVEQCAASIAPLIRLRVGSVSARFFRGLRRAGYPGCSGRVRCG
jgi:hypothetical protein